MKKISILVLNNAILGSIEGPHKIFSEVNNILERAGKPALFDIRLVGASKKINLSGNLFTVNASHLLQNSTRSDLIIIPAVNGDLGKAIAQNKKFTPWILRQYELGAEVASLCVGAFILAATGLLNGKRCSTHWIAAEEFKKMFPLVNLVSEGIITDENRIFSSGGAYSYLNLILYLVEKYAGRDIAILISKIFLIDMARESQSPFIIFKGQKGHEDEAVMQAQEYIEKNYKEKIIVGDLAGKVNLSRRNLERRFKKATSNTVNQYIQRVKIEAAKMELESNRGNVNDIMYEVGYNDPKAFRLMFKRFTGLSPVQYRSKYNRRIV